MGLSGVLIVRPTGAPGQAYADASTAFDDEALVVLGEIDPALNGTTAVPNATPWTFDLRQFAPKYFLVNGTAYANTPASTIPVTSGNTLLLRYANAGIQHHSIGVLGLHQRVLAADGSELPYPRTHGRRDHRARAVGRRPGLAAGDHGGLHPVPDLRRRPGAQQQHRRSGIGGMLAMLDSSRHRRRRHRRPGHQRRHPDPDRPGSGLYTLSASVSDATTGGANVTAAEYFIDSTSATPTGPGGR